MKIINNVLQCKCGRTLCDLCEEKRAVKVMENTKNGNKLNVCDSCYQEIWESEKSGT